MLHKSKWLLGGWMWAKERLNDLQDEIDIVTMFNVVMQD